MIRITLKPHPRKPPPLLILRILPKIRHRNPAILQIILLRLPNIRPLTRLMGNQNLTNQLPHKRRHNTTLQPTFAKYTHPFEPLLRSLEATDPTFDIFSAADIVSNASNLRKLFHVFSNKKKLTERFDLEWRHNLAQQSCTKQHGDD